jgi:hypothetical protein
MPPPEGSVLSVHRAFVVHLSAAGGPTRRRFSGRVEHLSSGRTAQFSSLTGLLTFLGEFLTDPRPRSVPPTGPAVYHRAPGRSTKLRRLSRGSSSTPVGGIAASSGDVTRSPGSFPAR